MRARVKARLGWALGGQAGQAIVFVAAAMVMLIGAAGLGIDGAESYFFNQAAERAAAAAALSGVVFMPSEFAPCCSGKDATDRAVAEARRNGFDTSDTADAVQVTVSKTSQPQQLEVTVSRDIPMFFMSMFGISTVHVSQSAIADYLTPILLGQAGNQIGSTVAQLGSGNSYYFQRMEGWSTGRSQGDAYTNNPDQPGWPTSTDVHAISLKNGNELSDPSLGSRGGYNYQVYLPQGGSIWVYNAVFGPEHSGSYNHCDNVAPPTGPVCNSAGPNYYSHEDDSDFNWQKTDFAAMRYTIFSVGNTFDRSQDSIVSQMTVLPIDATHWNASPPTYTDINTGAAITQTYNANGTPSNMAVYHNWVNIGSYLGAQDKAPGQPSITIRNPLYPALPGDLPPGTYRLRIDELNYDGSLAPTNPSQVNGYATAHKMLAVKALGPGGSDCTTASPPCAIGGWGDMAIYTPVSGTSFTVPIFQLPPSYAGQTIDVDIFDPGDINGAGNVTLNLIDPSTGLVATNTVKNVVVYDLGSSRSNGNGLSPPVTSCQLPVGGSIPNAPCQVGSGSQASFVATSSANGQNFNGQWVRVEIPIPTAYKSWNPNSPSTWYWKLQYSTSTSTTATDTITYTVGLKGTPARLISG